MKRPESERAARIGLQRSYTALCRVAEQLQLTPLFRHLVCEIR
jgi:hypothetical protein